MTNSGAQEASTGGVRQLAFDALLMSPMRYRLPPNSWPPVWALGFLMIFSGVSRITRGSLCAISAPLYVQALPEVQRTGAVGAVVAFWHCEPAAAALGSGASALVSTKL